VHVESGDELGRRAVDSGVRVYCFVVVPGVARWFFTGLGQERTLRYMLVIIALTSSAVVAELRLALGFAGALVLGTPWVASSAPRARTLVGSSEPTTA
jgi:hypothetical protein